MKTELYCRFMEDYEGFTNTEKSLLKMDKEAKIFFVTRNPILIFRMIRRYVFMVEKIANTLDDECMETYFTKF